MSVSLGPNSMQSATFLWKAQLNPHLRTSRGNRKDGSEPVAFNIAGLPYAGQYSQDDEDSIGEGAYAERVCVERVHAESVYAEGVHAEGVWAEGAERPYTPRAYAPPTLSCSSGDSN
jgi:hypothetical protein